MMPLKMVWPCAVLSCTQQSSLAASRITIARRARRAPAALPGRGRAASLTGDQPRDLGWPGAGSRRGGRGRLRGALGGSRRGQDVVRGEPGDHHQGQHHDRAPVEAAPRRQPDRRGRLEHRRGVDRPRGAVQRVVLADQWLGVGAGHPADAADVATGVDVTAAGREVVPLDAPDDRLADPGQLADAGDGEAGSVPCGGQGVTDAHAAPPPICRTGCRDPSPSVETDGPRREHGARAFSVGGLARLAGSRSARPGLRA